jgi:glutamyl-Q tRNA(Asp) synthetase
MIKASSVLRLAPSPNGYLHLGHAYSASVAQQLSRDLQGRLHLRIEDIDTGRCRQDFAEAIVEDLAWLGISWTDPVVYQSSRFSDYKAAAEELQALGVLYPCFASRTEVRTEAEANHLGTDPDGAALYSGLWKGRPDAEIAQRLSSGQSPALRLDTARALEIYSDRNNGQALTFIELSKDGQQQTIAADPLRWGDPVLVRKDTPASYHLSVVVDDAALGVSHVTRGRDLFAATDLQRLIQELLGLPAPQYHHHALLLDDNGGKLSKSSDATSIRSLRASGMTPEDIWLRVEQAPKR